MHVEYTTAENPTALFRRNLPPGLFTRAGALGFARIFAEEIVGAGLSSAVSIVLTDDDGSELTSLVAKQDRSSTPPKPLEPVWVCVDCLEPGDPARGCFFCGSYQFADLADLR